MSGPVARDPQPGEPEYRPRWGTAHERTDIYELRMLHADAEIRRLTAENDTLRRLYEHEAERRLVDAGNALADVIDRWFNNEPVEPTELSDALGSWRAVAGP